MAREDCNASGASRRPLFYSAAAVAAAGGCLSACPPCPPPGRPFQSPARWRSWCCWQRCWRRGACCLRSGGWRRERGKGGGKVWGAGGRVRQGGPALGQRRGSSLGGGGRTKVGHEAQLQAPQHHAHEVVGKGGPVRDHPAVDGPRQELQELHEHQGAREGGGVLGAQHLAHGGQGRCRQRHARQRAKERNAGVVQVRVARQRQQHQQEGCQRDEQAAHKQQPFSAAGGGG
jgi:hypothetical protein